jgi:hypothetical protein
MIITKVKRKYNIVKVEVANLERFKPIEIRLPSNMTRITGLLVTTSVKELLPPSQMERLGLVSFQANDKTDVFHIAEIGENGVALSDEAMAGVADPQFESDAAWVTGKVPQFKAVNIEGDNVFVKAWLKGEKFTQPYTIRIYLEYEEAEELIGVELERDMDEDRKEDLEPQEVNL